MGGAGSSWQVCRCWDDWVEREAELIRVGVAGPGALG